VIDKLAIPQENVTTIDITDGVNAVLKHMSDAASGKLVPLGDVDNIRKGNVMARVRMIYLYDQAKKQQALVLGTENKTEHRLGYYTRFGDEASDIEPIRGLYKTQVFELARYLQLPEKIIEKQPSAGLWSDQTDEKEFGFSYADADHVLYMHFEEKLSLEEIVRHGMSPETVKKVAAWVARNSFKHDLPKVYS
jgi:NAD+ synthase